MGERQNHIISAILCLMSVLCCTGSFAATAQQDILPSPINITWMFENMFFLRWEWKMPAGFQQCQFHTDVISNTSQPTSKTITQNMFRTVEVHKVNLNNQITFKVKAECNGSKSKPSETHVLLIPGNKVYVKKFSCIYFDVDYMNCTWEPVVDSVPATDYMLHYWHKHNTSEGKINPSAKHKHNTSEGKINPSAKFDQLLNSGTRCQHYIYKDGIPLGCHFKTLSVDSLFLMVIRDKSNTIRPFVASVRPEEVVKLSPPVIINATRTPNHSIYVQWTSSFRPTCYIDSEVEITNSRSKDKKKELVYRCPYTRKFNAIPEITYTVRVRVKPTFTISSSSLWSEWSEVHEIKGTGDSNITFYLLLILIPISVSIVTIIILIHLKRLQIIVFPPIPDPGKIFKKSYGDPSELQQWIRFGKVNVSSKPAKEEICSVILVETPLFSSQAE